MSTQLAIELLTEAKNLRINQGLIEKSYEDYLFRQAAKPLVMSQLITGSKAVADGDINTAESIYNNCLQDAGKYGLYDDHEIATQLSNLKSDIRKFLDRASMNFVKLQMF